MGVQTVLNNWTALQLAVQHQMGGPESKAIAEWMVSVIEDFFYENDNVIGSEVADWIGEILDTEFNTVCEDGSLEEVGDNLCTYFNRIRNGKEEEVLLELGKLKGCSVLNCKADPTSERKAAVDNKKQPKNQPDEDGWVTVSKSKKR